MDAIYSANVIQVLARMEAKAAARVQPYARPKDEPDTSAATLQTESASRVQDVQTGKVQTAEVSPKQVREQELAQDPLEILDAQAMPNYQRALIQASARRNQINADIARLKAQLAAKGEIADSDEAREIVEDLERLEAQVRQQINRIMRSQSLSRLQAEAPPVNVDNLVTTDLVAFVKNGQAAMLLGRFSNPAEALRESEEEPSSQGATPAAVFERVSRGDLPEAVVPELVKESSGNLLAELAMGAGRAA